MMHDWAPINYRGFYDVPRIFLTTHDGATLLFSCPFDEELDEYPAVYRVYAMPNLSDEDLQTNWEQLHSKALHYLGEVPVKAVEFDPSKRKAVRSSVLELVRNVHTT